MFVPTFLLVLCSLSLAINTPNLDYMTPTVFGTMVLCYSPYP